MRYQINTPSIISEILEGEVVILNLDKGIYYSLGGVGTDLWSFVVGGMSLPEIVGQFNNSPGLEPKICEFIDELLEHDLIVESAEAATQVPNLSGKLEFIAPKLHVYEDMKELLLLDPIHEVDQAGWPVAP